ncbi:hypothetical protein PFWH6_1258 [Pseudomonas fluorescens WH6]|nr:hypothetical protein PFWH6_1258 [Pseudomonas fluorescens WH6]
MISLWPFVRPESYFYEPYFYEICPHVANPSVISIKN